MLAADEAGWSFPSFQPWWDISGMPGPVLGFPVQGWHRHAGVGPVKSLGGNLGAGASVIWGDAERAEDDQPGEEKAQGKSLSKINLTQIIGTDCWNLSKPFRKLVLVRVHNCHKKNLTHTSNYKPLSGTLKILLFQPSVSIICVRFFCS